MTMRSSDVYPPAKRSAVMRAVKSKNTSPEIMVRKGLHAQGLRYRLNVSTLPGKPDLVFPKFKTVVFVHGCFWHGHSCQRGARTPKTNRDYWSNKVARNKSRDVAVLSALAEKGWHVITIWECELKTVDFSQIATDIRARAR